MTADPTSTKRRARPRPRGHADTRRGSRPHQAAVVEAPAEAAAAAPPDIAIPRPFLNTPRHVCPMKTGSKNPARTDTARPQGHADTRHHARRNPAAAVEAPTATATAPRDGDIFRSPRRPTCRPSPRKPRPTSTARPGRNIRETAHGTGRRWSRRQVTVVQVAEAAAATRLAVDTTAICRSLDAGRSRRPG